MNPSDPFIGTKMLFIALFALTICVQVTQCRAAESIERDTMQLRFETARVPVCRPV